MDALEKNRRRMVALLEELAIREGTRESLLDGVKLLRASCAVTRIPVMYEPSIVIVAQGRKRGYLGDQRFVYDARHYLTLTVPLPFECETEIGEDGPFLGVAVRIDLAMLGELVMQMGTSATGRDAHESSVTATQMDEALSNAAVRLLEAMQTPTDAAVLGPGVIREILYRVLCGRRGGALHSLLGMDATRMQMHRILHRMHTDYARRLDVARLAQEAGMSVSALHHHFKALTETSPLQYLKTIRLHKARMLMAQESVGASVAADRVGYESASQFSREFKRLFGFSPVEETQRMRAIFQNAGVPEWRMVG
ncbi:MAG TPA: AraC family transcriptional regulator [Edaphobacter sp.]